MLKSPKKWGISAAAGCLLLAGVAIYESQASNESKNYSTPRAVAPAAVQDSVTVTELQSKQVKVVSAQMTDFASQREAVGYIDFNQDRNVQVFSPWPGRIRQVFAKTGDDVKKGEPLFTIDSPDLVTAESNLIATAGVLQLTTKSLERAKKMLEVQANAPKDLEQAISDHQTAEGNYKAARDAVRIFGKSDVEMDKIVATRHVESELRVPSPFSGRVTVRNAQPGLLVQPGTTPAPFVVADLSTMWMVANVSEYDLPSMQIGQKVAVSVMAYPGHTFEGEISNIGAAIDPATHRIAVRSEIKDPRHELKPQMLASFLIRTGEASHSVAVPAGSVVREGDGTMTVFVTQDGRRFTRRTVKPGLEQNGMFQISEGLAAGEKLAGEGALFLSNALELQTR